MAFPTGDGKKKFGSRFVKNRYDSEHKEGPDDTTPEKKNPFAATGASKPSKAPSAEHEAAESSEFESGENEGAQEGPETPESVVAENGPAVSVHVTHDRTAHKHHVTSVHKGGHVHESDYATPEEANQAASKLGGAGNENPEQATGGAPAPESDGFNLPPL